jgi:PTH1 family peptidyl-tRNA hydrolase
LGGFVIDYYYIRGQMMIKLIVGLGNPGKEYSETRHNAGFWFVDSLVNKLGGSFVSEAKYFASLAKFCTSIS